MSEKDYWIVEAMTIYGGSFVKCLARCAQAADPNNLQRIKATWPEYWVEYERMGELLKAKSEQ